MTPPLTAFADFFDGESAVNRRAALTLEGSTLTIEPPEGAPLVWPLETLRRVPDQASPWILALTSTGGPLARVYVADPSLRRAIEVQAVGLGLGSPVRGRGRIMGWAAAAVASVAIIIFVLVPVMADQLAEFLPPEGEKALGDATLEQVRSALGETGFGALPFCETPTGTAALRKMEARVTAGMELPYPLSVSVLDHEMINAFALPGGHIVFFRGLIDAAKSPDEVAAVFAHELGHVTARDPARIALRTAGSIGVLGLLFGDFAGGTIVLFLAEQLIQADYTREAEAAADTFALKRLRATGLPAEALGTMFERLRAQFGDSEGIVAHFLSHPTLGDRIARAKAVGAGQGPTVPSLDGDEWAALRAICD